MSEINKARTTARKLIEKFQREADEDGSPVSKTLIKQCALICVEREEKIINDICVELKATEHYRQGKINELQAVKTSIQKHE